jgi:biotin operon repressor
MFDIGWIKLHRKLTDWKWYLDVPTTKLFIHLLLKTNFTQGNFQGIDIPRGSVVTGRKKLAEETGLSEKQVRTALKHLKKTGEVAIKSYSKFSVVTLVNYDRYQSVDQQESTSSPTGVQHESIKSPQYKKVRKKERKNSVISPLGDDVGDVGVTDFYDPNHDFGYIPKGKDF